MSQTLPTDPIRPGEVIDLPGLTMPDLSRIEPSNLYEEPFRSLATLMDHGVVNAEQAARHAIIALINAMGDPNNSRYEMGALADNCATVLALCQGITDKEESE